MELSNKLNENQWIEAFRNGEEHALAYFFTLHNKQLTFFAKQLVSYTDEAEDIVSECFFKLWQRRQGFESASKIKAFLFISCRNYCLNHIQHQKVKTGVHTRFLNENQDFSENALSLIIKSEVLNLINKEIEQLPEKMQEIFKMMYFDGKTTNEIALELALSVQTVRNQKTKAIDLLKLIVLKKDLSIASCMAFLLFL